VTTIITTDESDIAAIGAYLIQIGFPFVFETIYVNGHTATIIDFKEYRQWLHFGGHVEFHFAFHNLTSPPLAELMVIKLIGTNTQIQ
jgi:hypothetical protein